MSHNTEEEHSSDTDPLLGQQKPSTRGRRPTIGERSHSLLADIDVHVPKTHSPQVVILTMSVMIFVIIVGATLMGTPQVRILEDIICRHYYDGLKDSEGHIGLTEDIPENLCKGNEVQEELALIMGVGAFLDCIPGLLFAFPYGMLADKWGRKWIFGLSALGLILNFSWTGIIAWNWRIFPVRVVWFSSAFLVVGGGQTVLTNMVFAILSDVSTDANRANSFFIAGTGTLLAQIVAPSVAAWMMRTSSWRPYVLGIAIMCVGTALIVFIPETLRVQPSGGTLDEETAQTSRDNSPTPSIKADEGSVISRLSAIIRAKATHLYESTRIFHSAAMIVLLMSFVLHPLTGSIGEFFPRYMSRRFHWSLADTGYVVSARAITNVILYLAILPGISSLLTAPPPAAESRWYTRFLPRLSNRQKDLLIAKVSLIFLIIGTLMLGIAPTVGSFVAALMLSTLGFGISGVCRSLITMLVDKHHVGLLYAAISVVETVGLLGSSPMFAAVYSWALRKSGKGFSDAWLGAPFFATTIICIVFGAGIWFIRVPKEEISNQDEETNEGSRENGEAHI